MAAALVALLLWSSLAALSTRLTHVPPLFLTGATLTLGGALSLFKLPEWSWDKRFIALSAVALFSYHFLLFLAFRWANPLACNLINYLWPLLIVLLAPLFGRGLSLKWQHVVGAALGLLGAWLAIFSSGAGGDGGLKPAHGLALLAALTWSMYSLSLQRFSHVSSWTTGLACLVAGLLSLAASYFASEAPALSGTDIALLVVLGVGPMGLAFYLWDYALKRADPRRIGTLSYLTPVLSTAFLTSALGKSWSLALAGALILVLAGAALSRRARA